MSQRPADVPAAAPPSAARDPLPEERRETVVAVFGDTSRAGAWYPAEQLVAIAGFGDVTLDFRDADLPAGPTEIRPFAVFGDVEVIVPRHLDVELNGVSLFGSIKHTSDRRAGQKLFDRVLGKPPVPRPATPEEEEEEEDRWLVVEGWAVFGDVKVKVVDG